MLLQRSKFIDFCAAPDTKAHCSKFSFAQRSFVCRKIRVRTRSPPIETLGTDTCLNEGVAMGLAADQVKGVRRAFHVGRRSMTGRMKPRSPHETRIPERHAAATNAYWRRLRRVLCNTTAIVGISFAVAPAGVLMLASLGATPALAGGGDGNAGRSDCRWCGWC